MSSTVTGNAGGTTASGALVQAVNIYTKAIVTNAADSSGNFTLVLAAGIYNISATLASYVYYKGLQLSVDGSTSVSGVTLNPTALNATNYKSGTGVQAGV